MKTLADDADLIRAAQAGDMASLEVLLERHHDRLRAVCAKVVGPGADADDATQMALISIVNHLDSYDGRAKFTTWSYRIATNAAIDEMRKRQRRPTTSLDDDSRHRQVAAAGDLADAATARLVVEEGLAQLPDEFKMPVILRDLAGLDYDEIGEILGLPPGTVRSRISRGRGKLADLIGPTHENGNQATTRGVQGGDHD